MVDVKREIHDAYAMFKMQRNGRGGDPVSGRLYGMAKSVWAGKVMAAVENQPRPLGDLVLMCYAPDWEARSLDTVKRLLLSEFIRRNNAKIKQDRTLTKTAALAEVAVLDYQAQARGNPFATELVCQMSGVDQSNWYKADRPWRQWYGQMLRILNQWERRGLEQPRAVCEEIATAATVAADAE